MKSLIAFTDLEFTGLDPLRHEIIEIGLIVADISTLEEKLRWECKIKPEHIENGDPASLAVAGYKEDLWKDSISLKEGLEKYLSLTQDALFASWTAPYDWIFLLEAFKKAQLSHHLGHHTLDIFSVAFEKLREKTEVNGLGLRAVCKYLRIEQEQYPHRAITGTEKAFEVYKKLRIL